MVAECIILLMGCIVLVIPAPSLRAKDISKGVDWLTRYGYLPAPDPLTGRLQTQEGLISAIKTMQRFAGLKETGVLDKTTLEMMQKPRCSLPDIIGTAEWMRRRRKRYAHTGIAWKKKTLTWKVRTFPKNNTHLDSNNLRTLMYYALKVWGDATQLTFHEGNTVDADIMIDFSRSYHDDGYPFDGPGGTLAHAFFPGDYAAAGDAHFDDDETWSYNTHSPDYSTDLFAVAVHEFGHSLGLAHSSAENSIMKPYYQGSVGNPLDYHLPLDDVYGIEQLYGKKLQSPGDTPTAKTTVQPRIPFSPPQRTPQQPSPNLPDRCKANFDAVANIRGEVFFFKGKYFWRLERSRNLISFNAAQINNFWQGLPARLSRLDTVYERMTDSKIVFFSGSKYWVFKDTKAEDGYPRPITDFGLPSDGIDAAFIWGHNGKTYFFKDSQFWRYDESSRRMDSGYPKEISLWKGLPPNFDDVISWSNGDTYFFKDDRYWHFSGGNIEASSGYPKSVARDWMYCTVAVTDAPKSNPKARSDDKECTCSIKDHASNLFLSRILVLSLAVTAICCKF
ncbi:matrix metalloproteinase-17-like [Protopterus annectens]|uniref:matrix metalloproteinase-17-like n=1 Tax=Protopterus annectens TaxID=7888 RepID=UPI001CFA92E5|nr:matrix metalloproteinase-17-like [Protopterus annectens]